jgi:tetratricopeptide (TPR) repeat protein
MLGDIQLKLEMFDKVIESYKKVSELESDNEDIWLDFADVYFKTGNTEKAADIILEGIVHQPENISLRYRLINYLLLNKKEKEAYSLLEAALQINFIRHCEMLEYDPTLLRNQQILDLIELYKK